MSKNELALTDQHKGLSIEQVFQTVVDKQISQENIEVLKQLLAMDAEQKFAEAFVRLQSELPTITATTVIPNRGKYEKFEDVMAKIQPLLTKHGFTVSFSQDFKENRILVVCHLTNGRHTRSNPFAVRASGKADSETQADCKAATTAKRNALLQALNVIVRQDVMQDEDNNPTLEGECLSEDLAQELQRRVNETNSDELAFLRVAGISGISGRPAIKEYRQIPASKYELLNGLLKRKENLGR